MSDDEKKENDEQNVIPNVIPSEPAGDEESLSKIGKCQNCESLKSQAEEYKSGWQRAVADYQNLVKETDKRRGEWAQYARQMILEEFIPVYEHLKKALAVSLPMPEGENKRGWEQWRTGVEHIRKQFADILKNHGVEEIKTVGEKFDPALHEAVGEETSPSPLPEGGHRGVGESGMVIKEVEGGYRMGERVIKAAKVIINK